MSYWTRSYCTARSSSVRSISTRCTLIYHRLFCLFVFEACSRLLAASKMAQKMLFSDGVGPNKKSIGFCPHLSLAYGTIDKSTRSDVASIVSPPPTAREAAASSLVLVCTTGDVHSCWSEVHRFPTAPGEDGRSPVVWPSVLPIAILFGVNLAKLMVFKCT
jgi:hypothetical protein